MRPLCSDCGNPMAQDEVRLVGVMGDDPRQICESCRRKKEGGEFKAAVMQRTIRVAQGDTMYEAIMESCAPIAFELLKTTMVREGRVMNTEGTAMYEMGFVDAVYSIVCGDLKVVTVEKEETAQGGN